MLHIRCVRETDLGRLLDLARQATYGLTSLPPNPEVLAKAIDRARRALSSPDDGPSGAKWLFVLEDSLSGMVHGTCGIHDKTGGYHPFWSYRLTTVKRESQRFGIRRELQTLTLEQVHNGPSEIGSLFLAPTFRQRGAGRCLSLARFLHIANHRARFEDQLIAEMRGVIDETGRSPFWEGLGRHFFHMDFPEADHLSVTDKSFISDLIPLHPIYVCLLPPEAQAVIGQVHPRTRPALELLLQQGFQPTGQIDVFDGGPVVGCATAAVAAIASSQRLPCAAISSAIDESAGPPSHLVATCDLDVRMVACRPQLQADAIQISATAAKLLGCERDTPLRCCPLRPAAA
ncbi:MAG: arginine N-succinyltransferase [Planctomycetota bacterium]|nr:MAG: arginine N-succinyltransferase [Planctomycetota bacterium]